MRVKLLIAVGTAFILLSALIPNVRADTEIIVPEKTETNIVPIIFGNLSTSDEYQVPNDMCVSNDGTIFVVSAYPYWRNVRGLSPASFIAFKSNGSVRWVQQFSTFDRILLGVEVDESHVFATGGKSGSLYLAKYDFQGNNIWNITRSINNITYSRELGFKVSILDDGTIIVGVFSENYSSPIHYEYSLAAFNQVGDFLWSQIIKGYTSHCCDSSFIYISTNTTLQKRDNRGFISWTRQIDDFRPKLAGNDTLYSIINTGILSCTSRDISTRNKVTGEEEWSSNFRICNINHQVYNCSGYDYALGQDGSLLILIRASEITTWYLQTINQDGLLTSNTNLLDHYWINSKLDLGSDGNLIYVAGYNYNYGISVAVFDARQLSLFTHTTTNGESTPFTISDLQLIGIVTIGVIGVDATLIIFLRKKY
jgi:hypothetical protein